MENRVYRYELEVLSPTIVNSGYEIKNFEIIKQNDKVYILDLMKIFRLNKKFISLASQIKYEDNNFNLESFLKQNGLNNYQNYKKYELDLNGTYFRGGVIKEIIKTAGRPYIPGTSIKGAIRSSLIRAMNAEGDYKRSLSNILNRKVKNPEKTADDGAESYLFGGSHKSPFRFLRISDTSTCEYNSLELCEIKIMNICNGSVKWYSRNQNTDRINLATSIYSEAIKSGTKLEGRISQGFFDYFIDKDEIRNIKVLEDIASKIRKDIDNYIEREIQFFERYHVSEIVNFYRNLKNIKLGDNEFLIQIGFSTGYLPKSVVRNIDSSFISNLKRVNSSARIYDDLFPKTRRLAIKHDRTGTPLGWIKISLRDV